MNENVTIPMKLFYKIFNLVDALDITGCPAHLKPEYPGMLFALIQKKRSIELREAYSNIINAESEEERHNARMQYLLQKREKNQLF